MIKRLHCSISLLVMLSISSPVLAYSAFSPQQKPWAIMVYYGELTKSTLGQVLGGSPEMAREKLYSLEVSHVLGPKNYIAKFFDPIVSSVAFAGNITYRGDDRAGKIWEFIPYLAFRWSNLPWNRYVPTTFAIGEGLSYVTKVPYREAVDSSQGTRKLLNYLMFEVSVATPQLPELELVFRIHHRSGVYGLYDAGNSGSTALGVGLRYNF